MKLSYLYNQVVKLGAQRDPRKNKNIESYADTAILYGNPNTEIKKILIGIDIEVGEILLADKIRKREGLDLVLAHHPEGSEHYHRGVHGGSAGGDLQRNGHSGEFGDGRELDPL